jgi:peroxiredoxin
MSPETTLSSPLEVGAPAPDFTLPSTSGEKVTLSQALEENAVLLAFFPAAFTSVCTQELSSFHEEMGRFTAAGVRVFGVSVDLVPSLREFRAKYAMSTELLSDARREVSRRYGVLDEERFLARRSYFLIDKGGVLRWRHVEENNGQRRTNEEILAEIAKLGA